MFNTAIATWNVDDEFLVGSELQRFHILVIDPVLEEAVAPNVQAVCKVEPVG